MTSTTALPSAALVSVEGTWGLVRLGVVVVVCAGLAAALNRWGRLGHARDDLVAAARATVQLTLVGLVIAAVLRSWPLTLAFIAVMLTVASVTAGRRLVRGGPWWWAFAPVLAAAVPVSAGLVLSGLVPHRTIARAAAALALVPGLDQTRTVGLVTLPGAVVGMLLGGASPLQAAAVQLLVLVGLLLVQSVAVLVTLELVARGRLRV